MTERNVMEADQGNGKSTANNNRVFQTPLAWVFIVVSGLIILYVLVSAWGDRAFYDGLAEAAAVGVVGAGVVRVAYLFMAKGDVTVDTPELKSQAWGAAATLLAGGALLLETLAT